jgi:hypothetical protein
VILGPHTVSAFRIVRRRLKGDLRWVKGRNEPRSHFVPIVRHARDVLRL